MMTNLFLPLKKLDWSWAVEPLSRATVDYLRKLINTKYMEVWHVLGLECSCIWCTAWSFFFFFCTSCIFFGYGWTASLLHPLSWSSLRVASCWCCSRLCTRNSNLSLWLFVSCFRPHIFFLFLLFSILPSPPYLFCISAFSLLPVIDYPDSSSCTSAVPPPLPDRPFRLQEQ